MNAEANLPDPMVAPDDGALAHESGANIQGRIDVGSAVGDVRSKLETKFYSLLQPCHTSVRGLQGHKLYVGYFQMLSSVFSTVFC